MNALEKYAAKRFLIEKLAGHPFKGKDLVKDIPRLWNKLRGAVGLPKKRVLTKKHPRFTVPGTLNALAKVFGKRRGKPLSVSKQRRRAEFGSTKVQGPLSTEKRLWDHGLLERGKKKTAMAKWAEHGGGHAVAKLSELIETLTGIRKDAEKFDRGNSRAGVRLRKAATEASRELKALRAEVQNIKRSWKEQKK
jgi:hypothetical protein